MPGIFNTCTINCGSYRYHGRILISINHNVKKDSIIYKEIFDNIPDTGRFIFLDLGKGSHRSGNLNDVRFFRRTYLLYLIADSSKVFSASVKVKRNLKAGPANVKKFTSESTGFVADHIQFRDTFRISRDYSVILNYDTIIWRCGEYLLDKRDNHRYKTLLFDSRCWMAENINIGIYINSRDNDPQQRNNGIIEKFCYDNDTLYCRLYGGLYQWNEAMQYSKEEKSQGICPQDWHIPSDEEWEEMIGFLGGRDVAGSKLKSELSFWNDSTTLHPVTAGFNALPAGRRGPAGEIKRLGMNAYFWTSNMHQDETAWFYRLYKDNEFVIHYSYPVVYGFSVRCIKNRHGLQNK